MTKVFTAPFRIRPSSSFRFSIFSREGGAAALPSFRSDEISGQLSSSSHRLYAQLPGLMFYMVVFQWTTYQRWVVFTKATHRSLKEEVKWF